MKIQEALNNDTYDDWRLDSPEEPDACIHCGGDVENDRCIDCNWNKE